MIFKKFYENQLRNKVTNSFFSKLILYLNLKNFDGNTKNTRLSIDDLGSERAKICTFTETRC